MMEEQSVRDRETRHIHFAKHSYCKNCYEAEVTIEYTIFKRSVWVRVVQFP